MVGELQRLGDLLWIAGEVLQRIAGDLHWEVDGVRLDLAVAADLDDLKLLQELLNFFEPFLWVMSSCLLVRTNPN